MGGEEISRALATGDIPEAAVNLSFGYSVAHIFLLL
jgi:hypothetical protein